MASVCLYLQVHQPRRLRRYSVFEAGNHYFDDETNNRIASRVAERCYLPATQALLDRIKAHNGAFRVAFSLTGSIVEQLKETAPAALDQFKELAQTGCVEFLAETYNHSLSFLYSRDEFREQLDRHTAMIEEEFGQTPKVFRNTELIYNNELACFISSLGRFTAMLAEGTDGPLGTRSPNHLYHPPGLPSLPLLLKNYRLSDDIAFRFSNRGWREWPLTAEKFASWIHRVDGDGDGALCNLFMDFETFGEHQWEDTGILDFLHKLPDVVLELGDEFKTPSECVDGLTPDAEFDVPHMTSWADTERDLSAWVGNAMQSSALHELYRLEQPIKRTGDTDLLSDWRELTTSDHFYYMCTKYFADGDVHRYFNPYESPYDSYINFMNVLDNLRSRVQNCEN